MMVLENVEQALWCFCDADTRNKWCKMLGDGYVKDLLCPSIEQALRYAKESGLLDGSVF